MENESCKRYLGKASTLRRKHLIKAHVNLFIAVFCFTCLLSIGLNNKKIFLLVVKKTYILTKKQNSLCDFGLSLSTTKNVVKSWTYQRILQLNTNTRFTPVEISFSLLFEWQTTLFSVSNAVWPDEQRLLSDSVCSEHRCDSEIVFFLWPKLSATTNKRYNHFEQELASDFY